MDITTDRKRLFKTLAFLIFIIFIIDFFAQRFYWYLSIWWSDIPMHFLGGFWIGLAFLLFLSRKNNPLEPDSQFILKNIFGVLLIGVLWEFFELYFVNHITQNYFNTLDTVSDIFFDLAGGTFSILYFFKKTIFSNKNKVQ